jgi:hypothetical protein
VRDLLICTLRVPIHLSVNSLQGPPPSLVFLGVHMKGILPWLVRWAGRAVTIDFALVSSVQNIIFLTAHYFTLLVPIAQQPVQADVPGRLSLNMCLWF